MMSLKEKIRIIFLVISISVFYGANGLSFFKEFDENLLQSLGTNYRCDFEKGLCPFLTNSNKNKENWKISRGEFISTDYGPSLDHTLGTANGLYLFVNISSVKSSEVKLQTVVLKGSYCVRFFYYMYGAETQDLKVTVESVSNSHHTEEKFLHSNTQGDRWKEARFTVSETDAKKLNGYRLIFTATQKSTHRLGGAIALDDIELMSGGCTSKKGNSMELCTFDEHDCGYIADTEYTDKWVQKLHSNSSSNPSILPETDHTLGTEHGGFWYSAVEGGSSRVHRPTFLLSPVYKAPKNSLNCLQFFYYIDEGTPSWVWGKSENVYVEASISYPNSGTKIPTWLTTRANNATIQKQWRYAEVDVDITADYQFQFSALVDTYNEAIVAIDDVRLMTGRCPETGFCDFEEDMCSWKNCDKPYKWDRSSRSTKPNLETGPEFDNTLGTANGHFIVLSTRYIPKGSEAVFESEIFPPDEDELCLTFYYQMSGKYPGDLKVIRREGSLKNSTLWHMQGDQGSTWRKGMAIIHPSEEEYQILFQGITGEGLYTYNYMAIDDIRIRKGEMCKIIPPSAKPVEDYLSTTDEPFNYTYDFNTTYEPSNYTYDFNTTYEPSNFTNDFNITYWPSNYTYDFNTTYEPSNYTYDFNTTYEPSNYTYDFNTTYEPSNYTYDFNTTYEPSNYTYDFNTTYEPSNYTYDFNTTYEPSNYTYDFNTTYEPSNYTYDFNTTYDPSNYTYDFNRTYEPSNYTYDFSTTYDPSNYTYDLNTTYEPSNYTFDFRTTYEPSNFTYDFNTSYWPSNYTYDFNTTYEPTSTTYDRTDSTPEIRSSRGKFKSTTPKTASCLKDGDCLNGGVCKRMGRYEAFCDCPPYFGGDWCELDLCEKLHSKCQAMGAICKVVGLQAVCECPPETVYHPKMELCEDICDPWKCDHGTCEVVGRNYRCNCDKGYTGSRCDELTIQINRNFSSVWFIILAVINVCTFLLLIGMFCVICNVRRSMRR
ncbi:MAM and LDL-receptor class A domain-containing protein 1 [Nephila pilipes]|uniref:MAM and LDL-receptor class A domain-containing protein 1 n=1 Tax=Nephila pilipes TaxID=299642 RepID=A0A8X6QIP3_NEPPI|nr:MAM and LDL-receptor class A domain-containing protein 1 [Nephila pilipes]